MTTFRTRPLHRDFGVELLGVDATQPLDAAAFRDLFFASKLVLIRGQELSPDDQLRLSTYVGPVVDPPTFISNVEETGYHPEVQLLYHSDFAFTPTPLIGISLYCLEVAPGASPTTFVDGTSSAASLPDDLRAEIAGKDVRRRLVEVGGPDASQATFPRHTRPALWPHPRTGQPNLYVLEQQASHLEGLDDDASEALLARLFAHLYRPDAVYAHEWRPGDFLIWDNIALQHGRPANPRTVRRSLRRTVISEKTVAEIIAGLGFEKARSSPTALQLSRSEDGGDVRAAAARTR